WLFKQSIDKKMTLDLQQRLDVHKAELEKIRDNFLYQIHKDKITAEIKIQKAHEVYPEFYEKLLNSIGMINSFVGLSSELSFEEFSIADLEKYMVNKNIVAGQIEKLIEKIKEDRRSGISEMRKYITMLRFQETERTYFSMRNFLNQKSLYMSDEAFQECIKICDLLSEVMVHSNPQYREKDDALKAYRLGKQIIDEELPKLKKLFAQELSPKF
ncbi:MAG: hypothetical protein ACXVAX_12345, partial [Pseudobdellovibrio sp.]